MSLSSPSSLCSRGITLQRSIAAASPRVNAKLDFSKKFERTEHTNGTKDNGNHDEISVSGDVLNTLSLWLKRILGAGAFVIGTFVVAIGGIAIVLYTLCTAETMRNKPIDEMFESEEKPMKMPRYKNEIDCDRIVEKIKDRFIEHHVVKNNNNLFGIILGPAGTGKSYATQIACSKYPKGVIYTEIHYSRLVRSFAKDTGIRITPTPWDFIGKYFGSDYIRYYQIPNNNIGAIHKIMAILAERAAVYKKKHGVMPCLVIDNADLLAEAYPDKFQTLFLFAKDYANQGTLRVVFVISKGHTLQLIRSMVASSSIMEILDYPDEEAIGYLDKSGMPHSLSEKIVEYTGGRMSFLVNAIDICSIHSGNQTPEEKLLKEIKEELYYKHASASFEAMVSIDRSTLKKLLKEIQNSNDHDQSIDCQKMLCNRPEEANHRIEVITSLVNNNVFCYNARGHLQYHNRIIKNKASLYTR